MTDREYTRAAARLVRKEDRAGARYRRSLEKLAAQWEKIGGGDDE